MCGGVNVAIFFSLQVFHGRFLDLGRCMLFVESSFQCQFISRIAATMLSNVGWIITQSLWSVIYFRTGQLPLGAASKMAPRYYICRHPYVHDVTNMVSVPIMRTLWSLLAHNITPVVWCLCREDRSEHWGYIINRRERGAECTYRVCRRGVEGCDATPAERHDGLCDQQR